MPPFRKRMNVSITVSVLPHAVIVLRKVKLGARQGHPASMSYIIGLPPTANTAPYLGRHVMYDGCPGGQFSLHKFVTSLGWTLLAASIFRVLFCS